MIGPFTIEVEHFQACKHGQPACGDVFLSRRTGLRRHVTAVLSDGLGSGIKANVLATLTSTMALTFMERNLDLRRAAEIIMDTLPICSQRKIAYATFTIVDISPEGDCRMVEYDTPPFLLLRRQASADIARETVCINPNPRTGRNRSIVVSQFRLNEDDRLVFFSDGVVQAGTGRPQTPRGWGREAVATLASGLLQANPLLPAADLARCLVEAAVARDGYCPEDDISCAVVHFRRPRQLMLATGPPFDPRNDAQMARQLAEFPGRKVICGGTTARLIARELRREVNPDFGEMDLKVPPPSKIRGIDLVTEGNITLATTARLLEEENATTPLPGNAAGKLVQLLRDSDFIHFLVGTRINESHQNPNVPVELDLRRNIIRRIASRLETDGLKQTRLELI